MKVKGQNELIIAVAIVLIAAAVVTTQVLTSTDSGKATIYFAPDCQAADCDGSPPDCAGTCTATTPTLTTVFNGNKIDITITGDIGNLQKRIEGATTWTNLNNTGTFYEDFDIISGTTYEYRTNNAGTEQTSAYCMNDPSPPNCSWACSTQSCYAYSTISSVTVPNIPAIPTGLTAIPGTNPGEINLNWDATLGADYYKIYYLTNPKDSSCLTCTYPTTLTNTYTYVFSVEPASGLYFSVNACNSNGCSEYSSPMVFSYPKLGAEANGPYSGTIGTNITLTGAALFEVGGITTYLWSITGAGCTLTNETTLTPTANCSSEGTATANIVINADNGQATDTTAITITATTDTTPPIVNITSPLDGQTVSGTINLTADASDTSGITKVEFYIDTTLISTDTTSPYEYSWNSTTVSNASHIIKAIAIDPAGNTAENTITIQVDNLAVPDTPTGLTSLPGPNIGELTINWNAVLEATYYSVLISPDLEVNYYLATDPTYSQNNYLLSVSQENPESFLIYFKVMACNLTGCSLETTSQYDYLKLGAKTNGPYTGLINEPITLTASPLFAAGTPSYSWIIAGTSNCTPITSTEQNPIITCLNEGTSIANLTITADNGTATNTADITITSTADTTNPTINITNPSNGQTVLGTVNITANASDTSGIKHIEFIIDDSSKAIDSSSPYEYSWDTRTEANGSHTIKTRTEDAAGNTAETSITININNASSGIECGNGIIESGEECEFDSECNYSKTNCNTSNQTYGTRSITCSSCSCSTGNWNYDSPNSTSYCNNCNACGDGIQNCNETAESCPADFGGETDNTPPSIPTGLNVIKTTENTITLEWNPNTEQDLRRYQILYSTTANNYSKTEIALKTETSLILTGLKPDTKYYFAITAVDLSGNESLYSNEVSATTKKETITTVKTPANLTAELKDGNITLKWTHTNPKPSHYIIQRKGEFFEEITTTSDNSFTDKEITKGKTYAYRIAGFKDGKTSSYSEEVEVKVPECSEEKDDYCDKTCENDPDCNNDNLLQWGIGATIVVISAALAYVFFTFNI